MNYWLLKTEPTTFGLEHLVQANCQTTMWEGVRNYQARNFLRAMKVGDQAFFYHSNCQEPGIVGVVEVIQEHYPDPTAFDPESPYFDPKSTLEKPRWSVVKIRYLRTLKRNLLLKELKIQSELSSLALLRKGNRLSVMPVSKPEWEFILGMKNNTLI